MSLCRVWLSGSFSVVVPPAYGVRGVASAATTPGGRCYSHVVLNPTTSEFLMVGGVAMSTKYGDIFSLSTSSFQWRWVGGSTTPNEMPDFSLGKNSAYAGNVTALGARHSPVIWWSGDSVYIFSGMKANGVYSNDLW
jgi:hypothetical protein